MMNDDEIEQQSKRKRKALESIMMDFFVGASRHFEGRLDEGKISVAELRQFIKDWVFNLYGGWPNVTQWMPLPETAKTEAINDER